MAMNDDAMHSFQPFTMLLKSPPVPQKPRHPHPFDSSRVHVNHFVNQHRLQRLLGPLHTPSQPYLIDNRAIASHLAIIGASISYVLRKKMELTLSKFAIEIVPIILMISSFDIFNFKFQHIHLFCWLHYSTSQISRPITSE